MNNTRYRCQANAGAGWVDVRMMGESDLTIEWSPNEEGWIFYEPELSPGLTFSGEAFDYFYQHETSEDRCEPIAIRVDKRCQDGWTNIYEGTVSMEDGDWDRVNCKVKFSVARQSEIEWVS